MTRSAGFALLVVLWGLALLSLLVSQLGAAGRSETQLTANLRTAAELQAAADGAVEAAVFAMARPGVSRWATSGEHVLDAHGTRVTVRVRDEAGLVNPNTARPELLRALLLRLGMDAPHAESLADAIVDWRSPGQGARPHGAKAEAYRAAGFGYGPPGAPFETLGELRLVLGMTPEVLDALLPHLTLWWDGDPDVSVADAVVAAALLDVGSARPGGADAETRVVTMSVRAERGGSVVARHATIRLGYSPDGRPWRVLAWGPGAGQ